MITSLVKRLTILPRWVIIIIDIFVVAFSATVGYLLRFNFELGEIQKFNPFQGIALITFFGLISSLLTKSYAGIVRYTGVEDGLRIMRASFYGLGLACVINLIYHYNQGKNNIPYSVLLITFFCSFLFLFYYRLIVKTIFNYYKGDIQKKNNIAIFGAGHAGIMTKSAIDSDHRSSNKVVAFFEDDASMVGKEINGTRILDGRKELDKAIQDFNVNELIISISDLSFERKNEMVDMCLKRHVKVRAIPPVRKWVNGELSVSQIKEINIDDLLGRETIQIENAFLEKEFSNKVILVTGAAGSIGSELVRQLLQYNPLNLILIDQAESPLYELESELKEKTGGVTSIITFVADICNRDRIKYVFDKLKPDVVFHAAAYKHVPLMESNPYEAVMCNVIGTKFLADICIEYGVYKFIMISTDKAVNPTSIMGCSKRIAEIYVQSLNNHKEGMGLSHTSFVTTRFGNVLGSNGSVIPVFKKQIAAGGPVTVTHPEISRYFMTIPEASNLVLEAAVMGKGGEIFLFDMGRPVKVLDLAKKMILLSELELGKDIEIIFTGLRQGEKLFEELLNDSENTIPTYHEKILLARTSEYSYSRVTSMIELLDELVEDENELKMVALMKEIVPEFKSNYSRFEMLDR